MRKVIYLAGPYTSDDHFLRRKRFRQLTAAAARLIYEGYIVMSPITMTHPIDVHFVDKDIDLDSDFWCEADETWMSVCDEMAILPLEGWTESRGIKRERAWFEAHNRPVWVLDAKYANGLPTYAGKDLMTKKVHGVN